VVKKGKINVVKDCWSKCCWKK